MKHNEFEAGYQGETEIRASRLDHVAGQMVEILIPIVRQGVREGGFQCGDIPKTTKLLVYGLIHSSMMKYRRRTRRNIFCGSVIL